MASDVASGGEPDILALRGDMGQSPTQMSQPMGLANDVGVQSDPHHQGGLVALLEHLVKLIDDHVSKDSAFDAPRHDHRNVVQLLRIG